MDFGDWLIQKGKVTKEEYEQKQIEAKMLIGLAVDDKMMIERREVPTR